MTDLIDELKKSLPEAHAVALKQAHLQGELDQALVDFATNKPSSEALAALSSVLMRIEEIEQTPEVQAALAMLPASLRVLLAALFVDSKAVRNWLALFRS